MSTHVVVSQNLLPLLWRDGGLGGTKFDVLMIRFPMAELQATMDRAKKRWPRSPSLADLRADSRLLDLYRNSPTMQGHDFHDFRFVLTYWVSIE